LNVNDRSRFRESNPTDLSCSGAASRELSSSARLILGRATLVLAWYTVRADLSASCLLGIFEGAAARVDRLLSAGAAWRASHTIAVQGALVQTLPSVDEFVATDIHLRASFAATPLTVDDAAALFQLLKAFIESVQREVTEQTGHEVYLLPVLSVRGGSIEAEIKVKVDSE
jgi:hypothetical protein